MDMQDFKGSKGPWTVAKRNTIIRFKEDFRSIMSRNERGGLDLVAYGRPMVDETEVELANAYLMAAAPDLLEALLRVQRISKECGLDEDLGEEEHGYITAAINRALNLEG